MKCRKLILSTLFLTVFCIFTQQGPNLIGLALKLDAVFEKDGSSGVLARIDYLPKGKYYLSLGRILGYTEILLDGQVISYGKINLGTPLEITNQSRYLKIHWKSEEKWRDKLFDIPFLFNYDAGLFIQIWRDFNQFFLGPWSGLFIVIVALANIQVSNFQRERFFPYLWIGLGEALYTVYLSGFPELYSNASTNTLIQMLLRNFVSFSFLQMIKSYTEKCKKLIRLHIVFIPVILLVYVLDKDKIFFLYKLELLFCLISTIVACYYLVKSNIEQREIFLMAAFGFAWVFFQGLTLVLYWTYGPSHLTLWTPAIVIVLFCVNSYLIYYTATNLKNQAVYSQEILKVTNQVAHDIRSPLAALDLIALDLHLLPEETRILTRGAVNRIKDIAYSLLRESRAPLENELTAVLVEPLIEAVVSEKRIQYRNRVQLQIHFQVEPESYGLFVRARRTDLERLLSNIISNSIEAISDFGWINVSLKKLDSALEISIQDNGQGIPPNILPSLGKRGKTFGKKGGSGLGLFHAKESIESWGGKFTIQSEVKQGTSVKICLPLAVPASWFVPQIDLTKRHTIVVIDDDQSIHQIWKDRIGGKVVEIVHLTYPDALADKVDEFRKCDKSSILYLCDYEFNQSCHGIELLERLGIIENSILVTSRFEKHILEQAEALGLRVLPKGMAGFVPIVLN